MRGTANGRESASGSDVGPSREPATSVRSWVETAICAPSVHNTQPWRWTYRPPTIDLRAGPTRVLAADPDGRDLLISCGATLAHLEVAMRFDGRSPRVSVSETCSAASPLAMIVDGGRHTPSARDIALREAIDRRRSDRRAFRLGAGAAVLDDLDLSCSNYGVSLVVLDDDARPALSEIAEAGNAAHRWDPVHHQEIHWWAGHERVDDGVPRALLGDESIRRSTAGRAFPPGTLGAPPSTVDNATWIVLTTREDRPANWFATGRALSTILLSATAAQLATCPVSHAIQYPAGRESLRRLVRDHGNGSGLHPQILVRVGTAPFPSLTQWTPRRPLDDVFTDDAPT